MRRAELGDAAVLHFRHPASTGRWDAVSDMIPRTYKHVELVEKVDRCSVACQTYEFASVVAGVSRKGLRRLGGLTVDCEPFVQIFPLRQDHREPQIAGTEPVAYVLYQKHVGASKVARSLAC